MIKNKKIQLLIIFISLIVFSSSVYSAVAISEKNYEVKSLSANQRILEEISIFKSNSAGAATEGQTPTEINLKYNTSWLEDNLTKDVIFIFSKTENDSEIYQLISDFYSQNSNLLVSDYCNNLEIENTICSSIVVNQKTNIGNDGTVVFGAQTAGESSVTSIPIKTEELSEYTVAYTIIYSYENFGENPENLANPVFTEVIKIKFSNNLLQHLNSENTNLILSALTLEESNQTAENNYATGGLDSQINNVEKVDSQINWAIDDTYLQVNITLPESFDEFFVYPYVLITEENKDTIKQSIESLFIDLVSEDTLNLDKRTGSNYSFNLEATTSGVYYVLLFKKERSGRIIYTNHYLNVTLNSNLPEDYDFQIIENKNKTVSYSIGGAESITSALDDTGQFYEIVSGDGALNISFNLDAEYFNKVNYIKVFDYNSENADRITNEIISAINSMYQFGRVNNFNTINSNSYSLPLDSLTKDTQKYVFILNKGADNNIYYSQFYLDIFKNKDTIYNKKLLKVYKSLYYFYCSTCVELKYNLINMPNQGSEIASLISRLNANIDTDDQLIIPSIVAKRDTTESETGSVVTNEYYYEIIYTNKGKACIKENYPIIQDYSVDTGVGTHFRCVCVRHKGKNYYGVEKCNEYNTAVVYGPYNRIFSGADTYILGEYPSPLKESCWKAGETGCSESMTWQYPKQP